MSVMYIEVDPSMEVTHLRWADETFPRPANWNLADIFEYARIRGVGYVRIAQHLTNGGILRGGMPLGTWIVACHAMGIKVGVRSYNLHSNEE